MTHPDTLIPRAVVEQALERAYQLGQTYWQQADSDSWTQNKKSDETQVHFNALVTKTCEALQPQAAVSTLPDDVVESLRWLRSLCAEGMYKDRLGALNEWLTKHPLMQPQAAEESVRINFDVLYQFAEKNNISYNHLCNAVNDALDDNDALGDKATPPATQEAMRLALEALQLVPALIQYQFTGDRDAMNALQNASNACEAAIAALEGMVNRV